MLKFERIIARRFFQSRKNKSFVGFITAFAIGGVAIGSAALIITLAIVNGFSAEIQNKLVAFSSHVTISAFSGNSFAFPDSNLNILDSLKFIKKQSPSFSREAIARSGKSIEGVLVNGIIPGKETVQIKKYIIAGHYLQKNDSVKHPIVVGKKMAQLLSLELGSKLTLFGISGMPTPGNMPNVIQGRIVGIYDTGMQGFDDLFIYLPMASVQELFQKPGEITDITLETDNLYNADLYSDSLQNLIRWPYYSRSIFQTQSNLFNWITLQQQMIPIVILVLILIAIVNIVGTILMMIVDKTAEIGILRSMGTDRKQITRIFVFQGMFITGIGLAIGNVIGIGFCILQSQFHLIPLPAEAYFMNTVPILLSVTDIVLVNLMTVILALFASWIPSVVAARLNIADSVRFR
ncbi:MAG: ABC transporter permease [Bacteroidetes bacterium]|nr:ABC transporter permease [Bacteroidota bacterium]